MWIQATMLLTHPTMIPAGRSSSQTTNPSTTTTTTSSSSSTTTTIFYFPFIVSISFQTWRPTTTVASSNQLPHPRLQLSFENIEIGFGKSENQIRIKQTARFHHWSWLKNPIQVEMQPVLPSVRPPPPPQNESNTSGNATGAAICPAPAAAANWIKPSMERTFNRRWRPRPPFPSVHRHRI